MKNYVIGLDQGTTGSFAAVMDDNGKIAGSAYKSHQQFHPQPGWVQQDPQELWRNAIELLNKVMADAGIKPDDIAGVGLANQGESVVMWDRQTGEALYPVLVWQDIRTQAAIEVHASDSDTVSEIAHRTGLKLDSYFSASKIRWLLDHVPAAPDLLRANRLACGTLDSWLIWNLTGGQTFVTDVSTASRTLLFNIHTLVWDDWLLGLFDIPAEILPVVQETTGEFGRISYPGLHCQNVPIVASLVDQPAAMIGHGCLNASQIKATYGTGCFINLNTGATPISSQHDLLTTLVWQREEQATYGLDGGVFTAAASLHWLRDSLHLIDNIQDVDILCANLDDSGGAVWIPAQIGLGAPYWNRAIRGAWLGLELATEGKHMVRAMLEGIAARVAQIVGAMQSDTGLKIAEFRVDGGLTNVHTLMQLQADLLGQPVETLANTEATTQGVCGLVARATGLWATDDQISQQVHISHTYEPQMSQDQRLTILDRFDRGVRQLEAWHQDD